MKRTEAQRWEDEPWTLYSEVKRERDNLRRWLRRWRDRGLEHNGCLVVDRGELDSALAGEKPPKGGGKP